MVVSVTMSAPLFSAATPFLTASGEKVRVLA